MYSLPVGLAKIFHNCNYLEYPALGRMPDPPANGYVSSGADLGDLCCPCWCGSSPPPEREVEATEEPHKSKEESSGEQEA